MLVKAGKYAAKIKEYGIGTTKAGDPKVIIIFGFKDEMGRDTELTWQGSLKEGRARDITVDALLVCGLMGDDLSEIAKGTEGGALRLDREVSITVDNEEYEGKTSSKIKWVNALGGGAFREKLSHQEAVVRMAGMNLKSAVVSRRKETGISDSRTITEEMPF